MTQWGEQDIVRCVLARGGTSKGLYLHRADLPAPGPRRDALLARLMGSPDVGQIDGLGGARAITSKIAIVAPADRPGADVDYTFGQIGIDTGVVDWRGNCGNISAGVGPFAVDEGLVAVVEPITTVRIHNTNTDVVLIAEVPVRAGKAAVTGEFALPGVPGTGARIAMNWIATLGAVTGKVLPTGSGTDIITLGDGRTVRISVVDAGNPSVWVPATDVGLTGGELREEIDGDPEVLGTLREIRGRVAVRLGFCTKWEQADERSAVLPLIGVVAAPGGYRTLNGAEVQAQEADLRLRVVFMNELHASVPGTGSVSLAVASRTPGTVVYEVVSDHHAPELRIGHPSGVTSTEVRRTPGGEFSFVGFGRTARRLMQADALVPAGFTADQPDAAS